MTDDGHFTTDEDAAADTMIAVSVAPPDPISTGGQGAGSVPLALVDPTVVKLLVLLVCHSSLRAQASSILAAVRVGLDLDPTLDDVATVFGPEVGKAGLLKVGARALPRRVRQSFVAEVPNWPLASTDRTTLGVVVVGSSGAQTEELLESLTDSPEFATLPLRLRGLSLDGKANPTDPRVMSLPPRSPTRIDEAVLRLIRDIFAEAESDPGGLLSVSHLAAMTGVSPRLTDRVAPPDHESPSSAVGTLRGATDERYLVAPDGDTVEVAYLAVASGLESRPKNVWTRETELAVALDQMLHRLSPANLGQTWVIQMGLAREPLVVRGGTLDSPGSAHLDLPDEIQRITRTVGEVSDSYTRRGMSTTPATVVVILPPMPARGLGLQRALDRLGAISHAAWIVVAHDENGGLRGLPQNLVFHDKPDVVHEVAHSTFAARAENSSETPQDAADIEPESLEHEANSIETLGTLTTQEGPQP